MYVSFDLETPRSRREVTFRTCSALQQGCLKERETREKSEKKEKREKRAAPGPPKYRADPLRKVVDCPETVCDYNAGQYLPKVPTTSQAI